MFQNKLYTLDGLHLMNYQIDRALIDQNDEKKGFQVLFAAEILNSEFGEKCFTFFKKPEEENKTLFLFDVELDLSNKLDSENSERKENIIVGETHVIVNSAEEASEYMINIFETLQRAAFIYGESLKERAKKSPAKKING